MDLATAASPGPDESVKLIHVASLHVDRTRSSEATYKALAGLETAHSTAACFLNPVIAAPGNEMAIVNNVLLTGLELQMYESARQLIGKHSSKVAIVEMQKRSTGDVRRGSTYIETINSAEACQPHDTLSSNTIHKQVFS